MRAATAWFDRGLWRLVVVNGGLLICLAPVPGVVRVIVSSLVLAALAMFIPLMFRAIRAAVRADVNSKRRSRPHRRPPPRIGPEPGIFAPGRLVAGIATLLLAVSIGVAVDPSAAGWSRLAAPASAPADPEGPFAGSGCDCADGSHDDGSRRARDMSFPHRPSACPPATAGHRVGQRRHQEPTTSPSPVP